MIDLILEVMIGLILVGLSFLYKNCSVGWIYNGKGGGFFFDWGVVFNFFFEGVLFVLLF